MSLQDLVRLGDVVNLKRGYDLPTSSRIDGPYPVISSSGPTGLHSEFKVHPPGVVIGRYGTLGEVFFVETPFWPLNTTLYVEDFRGNDERWVAALLESLHLEQLAASSAVPGINRNHLHLLEVPQPCIEDQVLIGRCLRLFADLIENNRRRIELLEETARLLYREWFVGFRYPGHEEVPLVNSELGPMPKEWGIETLSNCPYQITKPKVSPFDLTKTYLATADVVNFNQIIGGTELLYDDLPSRAQHSPTPESVWIGRMAGYQKILFYLNDDTSIDDHILSSGFLGISCPAAWLPFVVLQFLDSLFEKRKEAFATGATQVSLTDSGAKQICT